MIYYCHIPKTSGTSLSACLNEYKDKLKFYSGVNAEEFYNKAKLTQHLAKRKDDDIIKGHYAATPFDMYPGIKCYSVIRSPVDRLLSVFRFSQQPISWRKSFKDVLYSFLTNKDPLRSSIGFDGRPNIQSLYLTQPLEWSNKEYGSVSVRQIDMNISDVLRIIKKNNISLSTMENRSYVINDISAELTKNTGNSIILNEKIKVNDNPFIIDAMDLVCEFYDEIYELNILDYQLYNYVSNHEKNNSRSLSPSDIII